MPNSAIPSSAIKAPRTPTNSPPTSTVKRNDSGSHKPGIQSGNNSNTTPPQGTIGPKNVVTSAHVPRSPLLLGCSPCVPVQIFVSDSNPLPPADDFSLSCKAASSRSTHPSSSRKRSDTSEATTHGSISGGPSFHNFVGQHLVSVIPTGGTASPYLSSPDMTNNVISPLTTSVPTAPRVPRSASGPSPARAYREPTLRAEDTTTSPDSVAHGFAPSDEEPAALSDPLENRNVILEEFDRAFGEQSNTSAHHSLSATSEKTKKRKTRAELQQNRNNFSLEDDGFVDDGELSFSGNKNTIFSTMQFYSTTQQPSQPHSMNNSSRGALSSGKDRSRQASLDAPSDTLAPVVKHPSCSITLTEEGPFGLASKQLSSQGNHHSAPRVPQGNSASVRSQKSMLNSSQVSLSVGSPKSPCSMSSFLPSSGGDNSAQQSVNVTAPITSRPRSSSRVEDVREKVMRERQAELDLKRQSLANTTNKIASAQVRKEQRHTTQPDARSRGWGAVLASTLIAFAFCDALDRNKRRKELQAVVIPRIHRALRRLLRIVRVRKKTSLGQLSRPSLATVQGDRILALFPEAQLHYLIGRLELSYFFEKETIICMGLEEDLCYVMAEGNANVLVNGTKVAVLKQGDVFGSVGMVSGEPRTATVIATGGPCYVWAVTRSVFEAYGMGDSRVQAALTILAEMRTANIRQVYSTFVTPLFMKKFPIFKGVGDDCLRTVLDKSSALACKSGTELVTPYTTSLSQKNVTSRRCYLLLRGWIQIQWVNRTPVELKGGMGTAEAIKRLIQFPDSTFTSLNGSTKKNADAIDAIRTREQRNSFARQSCVGNEEVNSSNSNGVICILQGPLLINVPPLVAGEVLPFAVECVTGCDVLFTQRDVLMEQDILELATIRKNCLLLHAEFIPPLKPQQLVNAIFRGNFSPSMFPCVKDLASASPQQQQQGNGSPSMATSSMSLSSSAVGKVKKSVASPFSCVLPLATSSPPAQRRKTPVCDGNAMIPNQRPLVLLANEVFYFSEESDHLDAMIVVRGQIEVSGGEVRGAPGGSGFGSLSSNSNSGDRSKAVTGASSSLSFAMWPELPIVYFGIGGSASGRGAPSSYYAKAVTSVDAVLVSRKELLYWIVSNVDDADLKGLVQSLAYSLHDHFNITQPFFSYKGLDCMNSTQTPYRSAYRLLPASPTAILAGRFRNIHAQYRKMNSSLASSRQDGEGLSRTTNFVATLLPSNAKGNRRPTVPFGDLNIQVGQQAQEAGTMLSSQQSREGGNFPTTCEEDEGTDSDAGDDILSDDDGCALHVDNTKSVFRLSTCEVSAFTEDSRSRNDSSSVDRRQLLPHDDSVDVDEGFVRIDQPSAKQKSELLQSLMDEVAFVNELLSSSNLSCPSTMASTRVPSASTASIANPKGKQSTRPPTNSSNASQAPVGKEQQKRSPRASGPPQQPSPRVLSSGAPRSPRVGPGPVHPPKSPKVPSTASPASPRLVITTFMSSTGSANSRKSSVTDKSPNIGSAKSPGGTHLTSAFSVPEDIPLR